MNIMMKVMNILSASKIKMTLRHLYAKWFAKEFIVIEKLIDIDYGRTLIITQPQSIYQLNQILTSQNYTFHMHDSLQRALYKVTVIRDKDARTYSIWDDKDGLTIYLENEILYSKVNESDTKSLLHLIES